MLQIQPIVAEYAQQHKDDGNATTLTIMVALSPAEMLALLVTTAATMPKMVQQIKNRQK